MMAKSEMVALENKSQEILINKTAATNTMPKQVVVFNAQDKQHDEHEGTVAAETT